LISLPDPLPSTAGDTPNLNSYTNCDGTDRNGGNRRSLWRPWLDDDPRISALLACDSCATFEADQPTVILQHLD